MKKKYKLQIAMYENILYIFYGRQRDNLLVFCCMSRCNHGLNRMLLIFGFMIRNLKFFYIIARLNWTMDTFNEVWQAENEIEANEIKTKHTLRILDSIQKRY